MGDLDLTVTLKGDGVARFDGFVRAIGSERFRLAETRAVNHTGDKALTAVKRALVVQTSAPRSTVNASVNRRAAAPGMDPVEYRITARGRALPLKRFGARQFRYGVRAKVWGRAQQFPHAFIVDRLGHGVFRREGKSRLPIAVMFGPSLPQELVRDQSAEAFEAVAGELPARLAHELRRLMPAP